jgi:hypothetical protein
MGFVKRRYVVLGVLLPLLDLLPLDKQALAVKIRLPKSFTLVSPLDRKVWLAVARVILRPLVLLSEERMVVQSSILVTSPPPPPVVAGDSPTLAATLGDGDGDGDGDGNDRDFDDDAAVFCLRRGFSEVVDISDDTPIGFGFRLGLGLGLGLGVGASSSWTKCLGMESRRIVSL